MEMQGFIVALIFQQILPNELLVGKVAGKK